MEITRVDALDLIARKIAKCNDEKLADVLFALFGDETLLNFTIVYDYSSDWYIKYGGDL